MPHWAGLDGLRGLAVAAVLAFHGGLAAVPGGFLGVSLFFTLSGFLITSIVVRERTATGGVSLPHFWARRARRLLPASAVALGLAMAVTVMVTPSAQQVEAFGDVRAAALNLANWRFIWRGDVYADVTRLASPVQHYWSLAIEEQFYLVFPVLALVALRWRPAALGAVFVAVIAWSLRQQIVIDDVARVYYGTDARAAELAVGGLLALGRERAAALMVGPARHLPDLLGALGLLVTLVLWWRVPITSSGLYGGGLAAVGFVSAMVVFGAVEGARVSRALSVGPIVGLGLISYGVYLFHFPIFLVLDGTRVPFDGLGLFVLRVVVTVALAVVSYKLLERPVRSGTLLRGHQSTVAFVGSLSVVVLASVVAASHYEGRGGSVELAGDVDVTLSTPPAPASAAGRAPHVVLVGDSTAATMGRGLQPWGRATGRLQVTMVTGAGCATLPGERLRVREGYEYSPKGCDALFSTAATIAEQQRADAIVVLIGSSQLGDWRYAGGAEWRDITGELVQQAYREALEQALDELDAVGVPILWADLPTPAWDLDAFGELLGGPLPGAGPIVLNDPDRAAIVNDITERTIPGHPSAVIWSWRDVLAGPDGSIAEGLLFDGLHVDEDRIPELAEGGLVEALDEAYDAVIARAPDGLRDPSDHLWSRDGSYS